MESSQIIFSHKEYKREGGWFGIVYRGLEFSNIQIGDKPKKVV